MSLADYKPVVLKDKEFLLPCIPEGEYAQSWAKAYKEEVQKRFDNNPNLIPSEDFSGANFFKVVLVGEIADREYGSRVGVALPRDLDKRVIGMVRDKFCTIPGALAFRDTNEVWEKNKRIAEELSGHIEQACGRLPKYAMVYGLKLEPWQEDEQGYQLKVLPTKEFTVVEDNRLSPEFNGRYFTETDKNGLPEHLTKEKGTNSRRWFTSNFRVSWFDLNCCSDLDCIGDYLAYSDGGGRVVLVRGRATRA